MVARRYTARALGRVLGIGEKEVLALTRDGIIQKGRDNKTGLYDIEAAAREIIASMRTQDKASYNQERARLMQVRRQSAEHELALQEKRLHRSEDLEIVISKILVSFKARIRSIPARVAPQAAKMSSQEEIFDLLKKATDEALQELSDIRTVLDEGTMTERAKADQDAGERREGERI